MKRKYFIFVILIFLFSACSTGLGQPEATATPEPTLAPTETATITPTPLPTATATVIRIPTQNFNLPTFTPFVLEINGSTVTPMPTGRAALQGLGFNMVTFSPKKIYWGACKPNSVLISATVSDPEEVFSVLLFYRVKDFEENDFTPWNTGTVMLDRGQGVFTHTMIGSEIDGHNHYLRAWVYFQLVATNLAGEELGRTRVYEKAFEIYPCPCLTPQTGCPINTPKKSP